MAILPIHQVRMANSKFLDLKQCREEKDSLWSQMRIYTAMINNLKGANSELKESLKLGEVILLDQKKLNAICINDLEKEHLRNKWLRLQRNVVIGAVVILSAKILIF